MGRFTRLGLLAALALAAAPASVVRAEVLDSSPGGFTVSHVQEVPVDTGVAWRAVVDDIGDWWLDDHTWWGDASRLSIQPRAGGCFCERNGRQQARHMVVTMVDPGALLRMGGGLGPLQGMGLDGSLEFRLAPLDGGGTRITLWYRVGGYTPDDLSKLAPAVDHVLAQQLASLGRFLQSQATPPQEDR